MKHIREDYNRRIQDAATKDSSLLLPGQKPIPDKEPVFLIRAQDKTAAATVEIWATLNEAMGGDAKAIAAARKIAKQMSKWPTKKLADLPRSSDNT